jgi:D-glycero-D-manno-heptose 1,7-bisphosphate phosphatase
VLRIFFTRKKRFHSPAIFLDRDGVINRRRPGDYVLNSSQFIFLPGIRSALKQLSTLGLPMIIISNQACVGKGLLKASALRKLTMQFHKTLRSDDVHLVAAYYCPHRSDEDCPCRKPKPGMLLQAAADFKIDLSRSVFVGDSYSDAQAALAAGCQPVLFGSGLGEPEAPAHSTQKHASARKVSELFPVVVKCLKKAGWPVQGTEPKH